MGSYQVGMFLKTYILSVTNIHIKKGFASNILVSLPFLKGLGYCRQGLLGETGRSIRATGDVHGGNYHLNSS